MLEEEEVCQEQTNHPAPRLFPVLSRISANNGTHTEETEKHLSRESATSKMCITACPATKHC